MSLLVTTVPINADGEGSDQTTVRLGPCRLALIRLSIGTLAQPDITITEEPNGATVLEVTDQEADADFYPVVSAVVGEVTSLLPRPILGRLQINVASADPDTVGELTLLYDH